MQLIAFRETEDIEDLAYRADRLDWRGEYDVELNYTELVGLRYEARRIVPDATISTKDKRIFLEVDRSTEGHKRIKTILLRYKSAFEQESYTALFPDKLPPCVLYSTKSVARAKNINATIAKLNLPYKAYAKVGPDAQHFVAAAVGGAADSGLPPAEEDETLVKLCNCLLYTSPSPRDATLSRMPSSA